MMMTTKKPRRIIWRNEFADRRVRPLVTHQTNNRLDQEGCETTSRENWMNGKEEEQSGKPKTGQSQMNNESDKIETTSVYTLGVVVFFAIELCAVLCYYTNNRCRIELSRQQYY